MASMHDPLYITYCAAAKDPAEEPMAAAWRYKSSRIDAVLALAVERGAGFRILSGRFGLLAAGEPIPWYDHLLTAGEVPAHAATVARQLADTGAGGVVYFTRGAAVDPGTPPYLACCQEACERADLPLRVVELPAGPLDLAMLDLLV